MKRKRQASKTTDDHTTELKPAEELATDSAAPATAEASPNESASGAQDAQEGAKFKPIRETFTSSLAGVHAGEDRRFRNPQSFVAFDDEKRADDEEKAELREKGFRYRPNDKGYSAMSTPETREARDGMAQKFADRRLNKTRGEPTRS